MQYVTFRRPRGWPSTKVAEYWLEVDSSGTTTRELGLDAFGEVIYRFKAAEHRHLTGEFYDNPILLPGVTTDSVMALTMDELDARLVERSDFDELWNRARDT
ncbi:hypothetical protein BH24ACT5_BH24ACT5_31840 [soil metagenome]